MSYRITLSEQERMDLKTACEFAVKYLTSLNPDNPNIEKYKKLARVFAYE